MEFNEKLMLEAKDLMYEFMCKLSDAQDALKELERHPEYFKTIENPTKSDIQEYNYVDVNSAELFGGCPSQCCKLSYPCDCRICDTLFHEANQNYALFIYAFNQAIVNLLQAIKQFGEADKFLDEAIKLYSQAILCYTKNHCCDYCKTLPKDCQWYCTCCICES